AAEHAVLVDDVEPQVQEVVPIQADRSGRIRYAEQRQAYWLGTALGDDVLHPAAVQNRPKVGASLQSLILRRELELLGRERPERRLRSEEHTSELQSRENLVCRLLLEKK